MIAEKHDALDTQVRDLVLASSAVPITQPGGEEERRKLALRLERGTSLSQEAREIAKAPFLPEHRRALAEARLLAASHALSPLYVGKLDEVETDFLIRDARPDSKLLRPLLARRYGTGAEKYAVNSASISLFDLATRVLDEVPAEHDNSSMPPDDARGGPSFAAVLRKVAHYAGLPLEGVSIREDLVASAAASGLWIWVANRPFGAREALRCAVHEVLGHLASTSNARAQAARIFQLGTAGAFEDQEGLAIALEEEAGFFDASRLRTLAGRVIATTRFHEGATFEEVAIDLHRDHGLRAYDSIVIAERTFRGGGTARDACYMRGFLRIRSALRRGDASVNEVRNGKITLRDLPLVRASIANNIVLEAPYRPEIAQALSFIDGAGLKRAPDFTKWLIDIA